jgi:Arc/MetJ-type ribon-helix-helix transcriptional regulator
MSSDASHSLQKRNRKMAKTQRVVFTFDDRSLASLKDLVDQGHFASMAEAVRESLAINRALQTQAKQGFTEILVRDPETKQERVMILPSLHPKSK